MKKTIFVLILIVFCLSGCSRWPVNTETEANTTTDNTTITEAQAERSTQVEQTTTQPVITTETTTAVVNNSDFVRIIDYIPDIHTQLRYATTDNFTGKKIYNFNEAWLRYGTVKKLINVQNELREKGYSLKIWDAFRPVAAQYDLWEAYPDSTYVANPNGGYSTHSYGNTLDVTLVKTDGTEVKMPTDFDDFSIRADRNYNDCDPEAAQNAKLLEDVMKSNGFTPYYSEWWHYSDNENSFGVDENFNIRQ